MKNKGCGQFIRVKGYNGGRMPCGAMLTDLAKKTAPYYCDSCKKRIEKENQNELRK